MAVAGRDGLSVTIDVVETLEQIGFPLPHHPSAKIRHEAIADFQRGFAFWQLTVDGYAGPKTRRALAYSRRHEGRCSPHFRYREFASKGSKDHTIKLSRALVLGLEELRDHVGPIAVDSGYRDPDHNEYVGGAGNSQHLYGNAIDPRPDLPLAAVKRVQRFSGIGIVKASGRVAHLDVRHVGPNTTGGTPTNPTIWFYA